METSVSAKQINNELHTICNAFGMNASHIFLLAGLVCSMILFAPYHYGFQGLYILCVMLFIPFLFEHTIQKKFLVKKKYKLSIFHSVAEKYHYSETKFQMQWFCFFVSCFFLLVWQFSHYLHPSENRFFQIYPSLLLVLQIMIRLIIGIFLRIKLHFALLKNNL